MRQLLALVTLLTLTACNSPAEPVLVEVEPVPEVVGDAGDPLDDGLPCCGEIPPEHDEAWLTRHERTFESEALDGAPVNVRDMLARIARVPARRAVFEWPEEERVDLSRTTDLGLALVRVTWSEEGIGRPESAEALWQVTRNVRARHCSTRAPSDRVRRGRRVPIPITQCRSSSGEVREVEPGTALDGWEETELSALRRLSRYVTGMAPPHRQRGEWLSTLVTCDAPPSGWRECVDADGDGGSDGTCNGSWSHFERRCSALMAHARDIVARRYPPRPCRGIPVAWGGDMDRTIMERRNAGRLRAGLRPLVALDCGGVENTYYGYPRRAPAPELPSDEDAGTVATGQVIAGSPFGPFDR